jgi:putative transposase
LAAATGISKSTVHRWLQTFSLQPQRQKHFKLSTDPYFVEKTQIQALDRTQPLLPMDLGYVEGVTHDYIRHGTGTRSSSGSSGRSRSPSPRSWTCT